MSIKRICICLFALLSLQASAAFAVGGSLDFTAPADAPALLDGLDFRFRMVSNPGMKADASYMHHFSFKASDNKPINGSFDLQSTSHGDKDTKAIVSLSFEEGQVIDVTSGASTSCSNQNKPDGRRVVTCVVDANGPDAPAMINGKTYRLIVERGHDSHPQQYFFGIRDEEKSTGFYLAWISFKNVLGLSSAGPSHSLAYFGSNSANCDAIPYTAYTEEAPVGMVEPASGRKEYPYRVAEGSEPFGPCASSIKFNNENTAATVEFAIKDFRKRIGD